jgi:hypothetical protein
MEPPKVKGIALREFTSWFRRHRGDEALLARARKLPPELLAMLDLHDAHLGILVSEWYPAELTHRLVDLAEEGLTAEERVAMLEGAAEQAVGHALRGVYRILFRALMTPERYARDGQKLFSRYYNTGIQEKVIENDCTHLTVVRDWTSHHPTLCEFLQYTGVVVYGAMGLRNVKSKRISCISKGAPVCSFRVTWTR